MDEQQQTVCIGGIDYGVEELTPDALHFIEHIQVAEKSKRNLLNQAEREDAVMVMFRARLEQEVKKLRKVELAI